MTGAIPNDLIVVSIDRRACPRRDDLSKARVKGQRDVVLDFATIVDHSTSPVRCTELLACSRPHNEAVEKLSQSG